jgi:putative nucleotidyltransferase-like protein
MLNAADVLYETVRMRGEWDAARLKDAWLRIDPSGLRELVGYEQVTIWLYRRLRELGVGDELPPAFWTWLIRRARVETANWLLVEAEAIRLAELLTAGGIPAVFLKGIARRLLADRYPYIDARFTIDVDVLLPAEQATSVWEDLKKSGYKFVADPNPTPVDLWHLIPLAGANRVAVEIHTSTSREIKPPDAWRRQMFESQVITRDKLSLRVPSMTELFWHTLTHAASDHTNAYRLHFLLDATVLMASGAALDWDVIGERINSREIRNRDALLRWLQAAAELAGVPLPFRLGTMPRPFPIRRALNWRLAAFRRAGDRPRLLEKLLEEGTRIEAGMPMQELVKGKELTLHARRRTASTVARGAYYTWRMVKG